MTDCIPAADFDSISTFPPAAKAPIIGLAVVFSVVVVVAVIVVVILVRKLYALKRVAGGLTANVEGVSADMKVIKPNVNGKLSASYEMDLQASVTSSVPEVLTNSLSMGLIDVSLDASSPFFAIFNVLPYAGLIVNTKGQIVKANPASKIKWGYNVKELEGRLYKDVIAPKEVGARLHKIEGLCGKEFELFEVDSFDVRKDGVEIEVEVIGTVIHIVGKEYIFIITGHVCYNSEGKRYK